MLEKLLMLKIFWDYLKNHPQFPISNTTVSNRRMTRTKECLKRLKDEGKHLGRPFGFTYKKLHNRHQKIKELLDQQVPKSQIAKQLGCSWTHTKSTLPLRYMLQHIP